MTAPAYTEEWVVGPGNTKFYTRLQRAEHQRGAVLLIHGFAEHIDRYNHVREAIVKAGYSFLSYDQRGYGRTALDAEHRTEGSSWGKTSRPQQLEDIEFFLNLTKERFKTDHLLLYGHSMGGALVLSYACIGPDTLKVRGLLKGVVSTSPLIRQTDPAPTWKLTAGGMLAHVKPWMLVPATLDVADLSHDPVVTEAYKNDPLIRQEGTLRGLDTMLRGGMDLLENQYKKWPKDLPLYLFHGSVDKITSPIVSRKFFDELKASDKEYCLMEGGRHELHNEPEFKAPLLEKIIQFFHKLSPEHAAAGGSSSKL